MAEKINPKRAPREIGNALFVQEIWLRIGKPQQGSPMMNRLFAILPFVFASACLGQGVITFYNDGLIGPNREPYRAGIFRDKPFVNGDPSGGNDVGAGEGYTVGLFLPGKTNALATTTFRTTTGTEVFAEAQDVVIPGVWPGSTTTLVVRVWDTRFGTYENTYCRGERGEITFHTRGLGGLNPDPRMPPIPPPDMGPSFIGLQMDGLPPGPCFGVAPALDLTSAEEAATVSQPMTFAAQQAAPVTVSVTLKPGNNLISNPLIAADNSIGALFKNIEGGVPWGTKVFKLVNGQYKTALWSALDNKFIPESVAGQTTLPGDGVLVFLPGNVDKTLTFSGQRLEGRICSEIPPGFSLKSSISPSDFNIEDASIQMFGGDRIYIVNVTTGYTFFGYNDLDEKWEPQLPIMRAGQAFLWFNPSRSSRTWPFSRSSCDNVLSVSRSNVDEMTLGWPLPSFAVETSSDLRTWTEMVPSGNTNTNLPTSSGHSFFRLRR